MVLLKEFGSQGFKIFTNLSSRKGIELVREFVLFIVVSICMAFLIEFYLIHYNDMYSVEVVELRRRQDDDHVLGLLLLIIYDVVLFSCTCLCVFGESCVVSCCIHRIISHPVVSCRPSRLHYTLISSADCKPQQDQRNQY